MPQGPLAPIGYVALGGALGSVARWALGSAIAARLGTWPLGTLIINITGCFLIGVSLTLIGARGWPEQVRWFLPIGILGGYTTFSSFGYETFKLLEQGRAPAALAYVLLSNTLGLAAVALGAALARRV